MSRVTRFASVVSSTPPFFHCERYFPEALSICLTKNQVSVQFPKL